MFPLPAGSVFFPLGSGDSVEKAPESPVAAALFSGNFSSAASAGDRGSGTAVSKSVFPVFRDLECHSRNLPDPAGPHEEAVSACDSAADFTVVDRSGGEHYTGGFAKDVRSASF